MIALIDYNQFSLQHGSREQARQEGLSQAGCCGRGQVRAMLAMHVLISCMTSLLCLISPSLSSAIVTASPARRGRKAKAADLEVTALAKEAKKEHEEEDNEEEKKKVGLKVPALPNDY